MFWFVRQVSICYCKVINTLSSSSNIHLQVFVVAVINTHMNSVEFTKHKKDLNSAYLEKIPGKHTIIFHKLKNICQCME